MIQKIRNSILLKFLCFVLIILFVLSGTFYTSYLYVRQTTQNYAETLAESLLRQSDNAISLYEENLRYNAESLYRSIVMYDLTEDEKDIREARISSYYSQIAYKNREIAAAIFYDNDMNTVVSLGKPVDMPSRQAYIRTGEDLNADRYFADSDEYYYAFYYPIYDGAGGSTAQLGMCVFILEPWRIDGTLKNILNDSVVAMQLSDSNKLDLSFHKFGDIPAGLSMEDLKSDRDYVYREGNWQNGIRISIAVSVSGNTAGSVAIRKMILVASILILLLLTVIVLFSYYQMAKPIRAIDKFIGNSIKHPERRLGLHRTDEIGNVAASLDHMLDENQRMIEEIKDSKIRLYETELAQQKMEILAYRNQINPHFLYNTLSCMRDMALINDENDIAEMAMALSDIFRYAVKGSNIVTVSDEVSYIGKFARIIEYRFMGKIMINVDADEEALDKPMIRFFLQPLVENSVFHGLESKMDAGFVNVTIKDVDGRLKMAVEDNGLGMDEETLKKLKEDIKDPHENTGIGLSNIVQRLKLFYGDDYTIKVRSQVDKGTVIWISVPDHIREHG
ncbi:MAG: Sensor histidine kinase YehU [Firmicutes bacterium ADurb.Bin354]|nr:MAG: Sensor histidine kinase YehU [Firmicutes bacterium ADurb.Bin354]